MTDKKPSLSRPKDRTLESFKAWMNEIVNSLAPDAPEGDNSEEHWIALWKKFWKSDNPLQEK